MNDAIFLFFYNLSHQFPYLGKAAVFISETFPYLVILFAFVFLLFHHEVLPSQNPLREFTKKWREIAFVFLTGVFAWIIARILKLLLRAERPFEIFPDMTNLFPEPGYSFPSGHATFFAAIAISIFLLHRRAGSAFIFFALLVGVARIIIGVHFPIDILGGFVLGALVAYYIKNV